MTQEELEIAQTESATPLQIVYILTNPCMPGVVKIGRTGNLENRVAALSSATSIPEPFVVAYAAYVDNAPFVERALHAAFAMHRMTGKEFFRLPVPSAIAALSLAEVEQVTLDVEDETPALIISEIRERNAQRLSKDKALIDLKDRLSRGASYNSQDELAESWGRPKQTVSDWLGEWERLGLIPPRLKNARCKSIVPA